MAESLSDPWVRDYLTDVAETHGAQLYNAPVSSGKKKVQLTDFLTYQENSYVWAWISDKDHRVPVRISKDAAVAYNCQHSRNIIDCRFSVVVISNYHPMFSPHPLGPNTTGNTPVSHISLEIGFVKLVGFGGHLFGNPRDLESDESIKEWVLGLRQDGGGGNILLLRKQQALAQNKKASPSPPPFSLYAPVSQCQATKLLEDVPKPKPELHQNFKRAYVKRWRTVEANPWKFEIRPATEELPNLYPTPPRCTPSPAPRPRQQGTPTDWSPSNRGSSVAPDKVTIIASGSEIRRHDEAEILSTGPPLPSDMERHATVDTVITSDTRSLQPPTPAQRTTRSSSPPLSTSPLRSSPEAVTRSSPLPSQLPPCSFPLPPSPSLPLLSSSLQIPLSIRRNVQRKVPRPGLPVSRLDPIKQGPVQILVPNSDTSGTGSSQSHSQSQHPSQSQRQLSSHSPAFSSSLTKKFKRLDASTPREEKPGSLTRHTSKMFAAPLPTHRGIDEQDTPSREKQNTERPETDLGKQEGSASARQPAPSAPKIEVLEVVGTSDTEEETDQLQLTHNTARSEVGINEHTRTRDADERIADADHQDNHDSVDKVVEVHSTPQRSSPRQPTGLPVVSVMQHSSSNDQDTDEVSIHHFRRLRERRESQSSMHSLFSDSSEDERIVSSLAPILPMNRKEDKMQEKARPAHVSHDPEAWKEPSFIARSKAKGKARVVKEPVVSAPSVKVAEKRRRSAQPESSVPKRVKAASPEVCQVASGQATEIVRPQDVGASANEKTQSSKRTSTSLTDTTEMATPSAALQSSKPRLANLAADFEGIELGKGVPIPTADMEDIKSILLRTGRIRTLGEEVEKDGRVYIMR